MAKNKKNKNKNGQKERNTDNKQEKLETMVDGHSRSDKVE